MKIFGDANGVTTVGTGTGGGADGADVIGNSASSIDQASVYGGGGADTIKFLNITANGLVVGGNGSDSIHLFSGAGTNGSINGGAGTDNLTKAQFVAVSLTNNATLNGGDGNDTITYLGGSAQVSAGTAETYNFVVAGLASGDVIKLTNTGLESATSVNWAGAGGKIRVLSAINLANLGGSAGSNFGTAANGDLAVYVTGGDTYFFTKTDASENYIKYVAKGTDLVATTAVGLVNNTSANFGFTLAQNNTTSDTGLVITIS